WKDQDLIPPLPQEVVVKLLEASSLCFLSTFSDDHPHLSLMNFTYFQAEEIIIFSTRRDTKKFDLVERGHNVAILVHDFPSVKADSAEGAESAASPEKSSRTFSVTLNGVAEIALSGPSAEKYRAIHLANNPNSAQFIVGENIAIITVRIQSARICNIQDKVTLWEV
ncbi:unnamed protein product, partial [Phaeothamnion confervicola]